ncbi:MAG: FecR domain-containing protein [Magnetococcales bacterium]|nr:FecR domain-containing protein [Magnetococcales bacterium]
MKKTLDTFLPTPSRLWAPQVMEPEGDRPLVLDHGDFLLSAQYTRQGGDLLLEGGDDHPGHSVLIPGYFSMDTPPDLVTGYDARIPAGLAGYLAGPAVPVVYAANETAAPVVSASDGVGQVASVEKGATIVRAGVRMAAEPGMAIKQGDVVETVKGGGIGLVYADNTTISLANSGRMVVEEMKFDPAKGEGRSTTNVVQGEFSFVSGQVAKMGADRMVFKTPVAVIGVRGTTVAGKASAEGSENSFTLLQDADGKVGQIAVTNQSGTILLSQPNQTTTITSFSAKPTPPVILSPQEVQSRYGAATRNLPPPPVNNDAGKSPKDGGDAAASGKEGSPDGGEGKEAKPTADGEKPPEGEAQPKEGGEAPPKEGEGVGAEGKPPLAGEGQTAPGAEGKPPGEGLSGAQGTTAPVDAKNVAPPSAKQDAFSQVTGNPLVQKSLTTLMGGNDNPILGGTQLSTSLRTDAMNLNPSQSGINSVGGLNLQGMQQGTSILSNPLAENKSVLPAATRVETTTVVPQNNQQNNQTTPARDAQQVSAPTGDSTTPASQTGQPGGSTTTQPGGSTTTQPGGSTPSDTHPGTSGGDSVTPVVTDPVTSDAIMLSVKDGFGSVEGPFYLDIDASLGNSTGMGPLSLTVGGLPANSTLSAGSMGSDGLWHLTTEQLPGLSLSLPQTGVSDTFALTVTASSTETASGQVKTASDTLGVWMAGQNDIYYQSYSYSPGTNNESAVWESHRSATGSATVDLLHQSLTYQEEFATDSPITSPFGSIVSQDDGSFEIALGTNGTAFGAVTETGTLGAFFFDQASYQTTTPSTLFGLIVPDGVGHDLASVAGTYRFAAVDDDSVSGPATSYGVVTLDGAGKGTAVEHGSSDGHPTTEAFDYQVQSNGEILITEADGGMMRGKISPDGSAFVLMDLQTNAYNLVIGLRQGTGTPDLGVLDGGSYAYGAYKTVINDSADPSIVYNNWFTKTGIADFEGNGTTGFLDQRIGDDYLVTWDDVNLMTDSQGWVQVSSLSNPQHNGVGFLSSDGNILIRVDTTTVDGSDSVLGVEIALRQDVVESQWQGETTSTGIALPKLVADGSDQGEGVTGIAVTSVTDVSGGGLWQYSLDGGTTWGDVHQPSTASALFLSNDANTRVRFLPDDDFSGDATLDYQVLRGTGSYLNGQSGVDVNAPGALFSKVTEEATVVVHSEIHDDYRVGINGYDTGLVGTTEKDLLLGQNGNDALRGNGGSDTLVGGSGNDTFYYYSAADSTVNAPDRIVDFGNGSGDKINFAPSMIVGSFNYIGSSTFHSLGYTEARFDATSGILQVDLGGDGTADMGIQLDDVSLVNLDSSDFGTSSFTI